MSPILCQGIMCIWVCMCAYVYTHVPAFNTVDSSYLCFIFYPLPMQSIRVHHKWKIWTFLGPPSYVYTPEMCVAFWFSRNISELFKASCEHVISQIFCLSFLAGFSFLTTGITVSVAAVLNNLCSLFLTNTLEIQLFSLSYFWIRSNRDKIHECVFSKDQPDRLNYDRSLGMRLSEKFKSIWLLKMASRLCFLQIIWSEALLVFKATSEKVETPQNSPFLMKCNFFFFLNTHFLNCCSFWLISEFWKSWFGQFLQCSQSF